MCFRANAMLEEQMLSVANGFSFVCPGILDSALMLSGESAGNNMRLKHLVEWSISMDGKHFHLLFFIGSKSNAELILYLDDALSKYQSGARFGRYIPNVDWEVMDRTHGMPRSGAHLVPSRAITEVTSEPIVDKASRVIRSVLGT